MRIFYCGKGKPRTVPPGLTHIEGNVYEASVSRVAREIGGKDPKRWSLTPDWPAAAEPDAEEEPIAVTEKRPAPSGPAGTVDDLDDEDDDGA